jgi:hypothetical protein
MERNKMKNNPAVKRKIFILIVLALSGSILLFGISWIQQTQSQFAAASSAVRDISILSRKIVSQTNDFQFAGSEKAYLATMRKVRALVREMEIKHLSLFKGNPGFSSDANFAGEIKTIYFASPVNAVAQVREFLDRANFLLEVPYAEFTPKNHYLRLLKNAVQGNLTQTVNQVIHAYRGKSENKVYQQLTILIISLFVIWTIAFLQYINLLRLRQPSLVLQKVKKNQNSVATTLKDISHQPAPQKVLDTVNTNGQFSPANRFPGKKKPVIMPIRVNADAMV